MRAYDLPLPCRARANPGIERMRYKRVDAKGRPISKRLQLILGRLNVSISAKDMHLPGLELHELKGDRRRTWAVSVSGNWRVTFRFEGKDATEVDYEDYH
jgi:proteic killer suppression protein